LQGVGGSYFVPARQKVVLPEKPGYFDPTDRIFGVDAMVSAGSWGEAYQKQDMVRATIEDFYGLVVAIAEVRYLSLIETRFKVVGDPRLG